MKHTSTHSSPLPRRAARTALALAAALLAGSAWAQAWPAKPIRMIVCFPPGNAADLTARAMGPLLAEKVGQPVIIDNRGGAGGVIGVDAVAKSAPDGYTLGVCSLSPITIIPATRAKMPYDPAKDLQPILLTNKGPLVLVVKRNSPFNSIDDLIAHARANPGKLSYGSLGTGTVSQLATEAFKAAAGLQITEISYKGSAQALTDLIGGHVDLMLDGAATAVAQMNAGTVKGLAVTTLKRSVFAPNVMALDESNLPGLKGFDVFGWVGVFAPAGVPGDVVTRLNRELGLLLREPSVMQRAAAGGQEMSEPNTPAQFRDFIRADLARWTALARKLNIETKE